MKKNFNEKKNDLKHGKKHTLRKKGSSLDSAYLCITATSNNAILTLTNEQGGAITQLSCGAVGFKNAKKSAPFAFQTALTNMIERIKDLGIFNIKIKIHTTGITHVRDHLIDLANSGLNILRISDSTSKNHNGPRAPSPRKP